MDIGHALIEAQVACEGVGWHDLMVLKGQLCTWNSGVGGRHDKQQVLIRGL